MIRLAEISLEELHQALDDTTTKIETERVLVAICTNKDRLCR